MPIAVRDDNVARLALLHPVGDCIQHFGEGPRTGQIDAWSPARPMEVVVGETRDDRQSLEIDLSGCWTGQPAHLVIGADRGEFVASNGTAWAEEYWSSTVTMLAL